MKGHPAPEGQPAEQLVVAKERGRRTEVLGAGIINAGRARATAEQMLEARDRNRALFRELRG